MFVWGGTSSRFQASFYVLLVFSEVYVHCMYRSIKFSLMHRTVIITTISIHKSSWTNLIYAQHMQNFLLPGIASYWSLHMHNVSANQSGFGPLLYSQFPRNHYKFILKLWQIKFKWCWWMVHFVQIIFTPLSKLVWNSEICWTVARELFRIVTSQILETEMRRAHTHFLEGSLRFLFN